METPLAIGLTKGIQKVLHSSDCYVSLLHLKSDGSLPDCIEKGELDGLIIRSGDETVTHRIQNMPVVYAFQSSLQTRSCDAVLVDNTLCGEWAAQKLLEDGAEKPVFVEPDDSNVLSLMIRCLAFQQVFSINGYFSRRLTVSEFEDSWGDFDADAVFIPGHDSDVRRVEKVLQFSPKACALGTVMTEDRELDIPDQIKHFSLHIDPEKIGMAAARQLLWRRTHPLADHCRILIPPKELSVFKENAYVSS
jgi:DNA-binding LacI/PurR family transcriptional regulator